MLGVKSYSGLLALIYTGLVSVHVAAIACDLRDHKDATVIDVCSEAGLVVEFTDKLVSHVSGQNPDTGTRCQCQYDSSGDTKLHMFTEKLDIPSTDVSKYTTAASFYRPFWKMWSLFECDQPTGTGFQATMDDRQPSLTGSFRPGQGELCLLHTLWNKGWKTRYCKGKDW